MDGLIAIWQFRNISISQYCEIDILRNSCTENRKTVNSSKPNLFTSWDLQKNIFTLKIN